LHRFQICVLFLVQSVTSARMFQIMMQDFLEAESVALEKRILTRRAGYICFMQRATRLMSRNPTLLRMF
jgi:hypothetical protein